MYVHFFAWNFVQYFINIFDLTRYGLSVYHKHDIDMHDDWQDSVVNPTNQLGLLIIGLLPLN